MPGFRVTKRKPYLLAREYRNAEKLVFAASQNEF